MRWQCGKRAYWIWYTYACPRNSYHVTWHFHNTTQSHVTSHWIPLRWFTKSWDSVWRSDTIVLRFQHWTGGQHFIERWRISRNSIGPLFYVFELFSPNLRPKAFCIEKRIFLFTLVARFQLAYRHKNFMVGLRMFWDPEKTNVLHSPKNRYTHLFFFLEQLKYWCTFRAAILSEVMFFKYSMREAHAREPPSKFLRIDWKILRAGTVLSKSLTYAVMARNIEEPPKSESPCKSTLERPWI